MGESVKKDDVAQAIARADSAAARADAAATEAAHSAVRLEDKVQSIAVIVAASGAKLDALSDKVVSLTSAVTDHMNVHTGHNERLVALETKSADLDKARDRKLGVVLGLVGIVGSLLAALVGGMVDHFIGK